MRHGLHNQKVSRSKRGEGERPDILVVAELERLREYLGSAADDYDRLLTYLENAYNETDMPLPFEEAFAEAATACRESSEFLRAVSGGKDVHPAYTSELVKRNQRIVELEREVKRLREALTPFAEVGRIVDDQRPDASDAVPFSVMVDEEDNSVASLTWGNLRAASDALSTSPQGDEHE